MSSLSVHLRLPEDHSGLPFHASCPVCRRDRLVGSLEGDEIVSRRTQAAVAVGLLAFSGIGAPAAAVAAGPDQDIDGSTEVVESPDPGETDLDETTIGWGDGGAAPLEDDPAVAPELEDGSTEPAPRDATDESLVEDPAAVVEPAPEPIALAAPPVADPTATTDVPEPAASGDARVDTAEPTNRKQPVKHTKPAVQPRVIVAPAPVVAPAATNAVTVRVTAGTNQSTVVRASSGARFHVIQRGESLWSIASDVLGDDASSAQVSREVSRLWELNQERIGTGSPDLVYAGTRLRLR
jgi:hypothetical protein